MINEEGEFKAELRQSKVVSTEEMPYVAPAAWCIEFCRKADIWLAKRGVSEPKWQSWGFQTGKNSQADVPLGKEEP